MCLFILVRAELVVKIHFLKTNIESTLFFYQLWFVCVVCVWCQFKNLNLILNVEKLRINITLVCLRLTRVRAQPHARMSVSRVPHHVPRHCLCRLMSASTVLRASQPLPERSHRFRLKLWNAISSRFRSDPPFSPRALSTIQWLSPSREGTTRL